MISASHHGGIGTEVVSHFTPFPMLQASPVLSEVTSRVLKRLMLVFTFYFSISSFGCHIRTFKEI